MGNENIIKINIDVTECELAELRKRIIPTLGTSVLYNSDKWVCDKKRKNPASQRNSYTIYYTKIPSEYKNLVKDFAIVSFSKRNNLAGVQCVVKRVATFFRFLSDRHYDFKSLNKEMASEFKKFLINKPGSESNRNAIWGAVKTFINAIKKLDCAPPKNFFDGTNPFEKDITAHDEKYVPKYILRKLDIAFMNEKIPLYIRLIYWICRSIPSRIGEVLAMNIDCVKPVNPEQDEYVIIIPTFKQNGGYTKAQIRRIYLKYTGHGKFLIDMINMQGKTALSLQEDIVDDTQKNLLFTRQIEKVSKNGTPYKNKLPVVLKTQTVYDWIDKVIYVCDIRDKNGELYHLTSHQLRHNGITDRLYNGFSLIQTTLMTAHHGTVMPETSYFHPQNDIQEEVQKNIIAHSNKPAVYFRGQILNLDEKTEKRLLQNIKSRRIPGLGICRDFTNCKAFRCMGCDYNIPDADDLPYFEEQIRILQDRLQKVGNHIFLRENILYNLDLLKKVVAKIKKGLEKS